MSENVIEGLEKPNQYIQIGSREFYTFLLRNSANSRSLSLEDLPVELEIVATGSHLTKEGRRREISDLKKECERLAKKIDKKYNLGDQDQIALEQVLQGFTQVGLLENGEDYEISIHQAADQTGYQLERQHGLERMNASPKLFKIITDEIFDQIVLLDKGVQLRISSNPLFQRSAAMANTIIDKLSEGLLYYSPKFLEVTPLHKIQDRVRQWQDYRDQVSASMREK